MSPPDGTSPARQLYSTAWKAAMTYFWFEIAAVTMAFAVVLAVAPLLGALLLAQGVFTGWPAVEVSLLITIPFSVPVAFLASRWVFGIASEAYPSTAGFPFRLVRRIRIARRPPGAREASPSQVPIGALGGGGPR